MLCNRLCATTGSMTLSWKLPDCPPIAIVASLPMTWAQTMATASGMTGLTLPGMMLEPGCSAGSAISPIPASGPEFIQRRSLAIFVRLTASTRSWPDASTAASWLLSDSNRLSADRERHAGLLAKQHGDFVAELGMRVDAGADSGAALRQRRQALHRVAKPLAGMVDLRAPAVELLAERHRHRIHQVRAPGLDDVARLVGLGFQRLATGAQVPAAAAS